MLCAVLCLVVSPKYIPLFKFAANTLLGILYYVVICREGVASSQFHFCRTLFLSHNCNSPLMPIFRYVAVQVRVTRFCHHIEASLFAIHFILLLLLPWYMSLWHFLLYFITRYYYQGRGQLFYLEGCSLLSETRPTPKTRPDWCALCAVEGVYIAGVMYNALLGGGGRYLVDFHV